MGQRRWQRNARSFQNQQNIREVDLRDSADGICFWQSHITALVRADLAETQRETKQRWN